MCQNGHNVYHSIHVFYGPYRNLYKVSAYCCENDITKRKGDNVYVISIHVFIFIYLSIYLIIHSFYLISTVKQNKNIHALCKYGKRFSIARTFMKVIVYHIQCPIRSFTLLER